MIASLPMYALPSLVAANQAFWHALSKRLMAGGMEDVPLGLDTTAAELVGPGVLFTQICGLPLFRRFAGQGVILAVPGYGFPGCEGPWHRAAFIVRTSDKVQRLAELGGRVFGFNSVHSNTGTNLPRLALARIAGGRPFFRRIVRTGAHVASLAALAAGEIDLCSVDCVTWGFVQRDRPRLAAGLRVLEWTPPSPCLPFVTSAATSQADILALRAGLAGLFADPDAAAILAGLRLTGLYELPDDDYGVLRDYEAEAARLGYPALR